MKEMLMALANTDTVPTRLVSFQAQLWWVPPSPPPPPQSDRFSSSSFRKGHLLEQCHENGGVQTRKKKKVIVIPITLGSRTFFFMSLIMQNALPAHRTGLCWFQWKRTPSDPVLRTNFISVTWPLFQVVRIESDIFYLFMLYTTQ